MTVPGQPQEGAPSTGQEPAGVTATSPAPASPGQGQEPASRQDQPDRYDADYVKGLRKSEADARKRLQDAEARLKAADDEKLSEAERLQKRADEAEKRAAEAEGRARQALVRSAVMVELSKQGAVNPARIYALVDQSAIDLDDAGTVSGAEKAVERLLKDEPYLKADPSAGKAQRGTATDLKASGAQPTREDTDQVRQKLIASGNYPRF